VRMEWEVLLDLATRLGLTAEVPLTAGAVFAELSQMVPFYRGLTLDEIGGDGIRWPEREESAAAARNTFGPLGFAPPADPPAPLEPADGILRLAPRPALWASWITEHSPSLRFLAADQAIELNPLDAERLGLHTGGEVEVSANDERITATVRVRRSVPRGTASMLLGTKENNANQLLDGASTLIELSRTADRRLPTADLST
jgi:NADH-quinone oxidoreductase subunit G